ncbi:hypothetical protein [Curtobacterium sp. BRB10]|uniref:hypothetical protein n=1 Tax=Curtobacterium sp. BRB10 TaxID=2962579 RepID=UPI002882BBC5|nr:hypothetical protein [Curtobacterium sp. BRB10]MDT0234885.1 hypothetical protein [Curtobacterium sp. BRB10]
MTDVDSAAPDPDENAGESGAPLTPEDRITALEQLVVPMFKDWASRDAAENDEPAIGTAGAVAETAEEDAGGPWSWARVNDERRQALAGELAAFVTYLADRYLRHLSAEAYPFAPRWFENPVAVEILTGVMVAHQAVYTDYKTEPSRDLADWHEHILWPALDRIKALGLFPNGEVKPRSRKVDVDDEARAFLAGELAEQGTSEPASTAVDVHDAPTGPITLP